MPNENSVIGRSHVELEEGQTWGSVVSEAAKEYGGIRGHFRNNPDEE